MTAESAEPRGGAFTRGRLAFRRWRKTRPFWGGLLLIFSGAWILLSANRDLGNLQVHLGMAGFQSYVIPIVLILCGALAWATPAQRVFYGIIGVLVAIYSLIGANLGGFIIGFLLGTFGGALSASWVPDKRPSTATATDTSDASAGDAASSEAAAGDPDDSDTDVRESSGLDVIGPDEPAGDDEDEQTRTGPLHDTLPTATRSPLVPAQADATDADDSQGDDEEGEQSSRFPGPRHAADESAVAGSDLQTDADEPTGLASRLRKSPRGPIALLAVLSVGAIALVTFQSPTPASAETCASPAYQQALEKLGVTGSGAPNGKTAATAKTRTTKPSSSDATSKTGAGKATTRATATPSAAQPAPSPSPSKPAGPVKSLLNVLGGLLPGDDPTSEAPTASPTPPDSPPTATPKPSGSPKPTATPTAKPTVHPTTRPTKKVTPTTPSPSPSDTPICSTSKVFSSDPLNGVTAKPSKMTTADLKLHNLAYKGIRPINNGAMDALWFTMDSSTSTPFELQPVDGDHLLDITSSELTVSGNVQFYCSSISGDLVLAGVPTPVRLTFTPDSPPPLVLPEMEFTDVTIQLVYVQSDVLTAKDLNKTSD